MFNFLMAVRVPSIPKAFGTMNPFGAAFLSVVLFVPAVATTTASQEPDPTSSPTAAVSQTTLPYNLHQGTGWCGSGFDDCIEDYETHDACFQACSEKWGTRLHATDWWKEDGECCCQDSCDYWVDGCDQGVETAVVPGRAVPEHADCVDPCIVCPEGATAGEDAVLPTGEDVTCGDLLDAANLEDKKSPDCDLFKSFEFFCCPDNQAQVQSPCIVCPEGITVGEDSVVPDEGGVSWGGSTCGDLMNYAKYEDKESLLCDGYKTVEYFCCPVQQAESPCAFCSGGITADESLVVPFGGGLNCFEVEEEAAITLKSSEDCSLRIMPAEFYCCPTADLHQGTGWCGSGFNDCIGDYETHEACFQACGEKWGTRLHATDWDKEFGECCCQDSCEFWSEVCESSYETAIVPGKTAPEHANCPTLTSAMVHQGTGWCGAGFDDCIGYYDTHEACFQACSDKWGTRLHATDWWKEDGWCCCQDSCEFWTEACDSGVETAIVPGKTAPEHADCDPCIFCPEGPTAGADFLIPDWEETCGEVMNDAPNKEKESFACADYKKFEFVCCPDQVSPCAFCSGGIIADESFAIPFPADLDWLAGFNCFEVKEQAVITQESSEHCSLGIMPAEFYCCPTSTSAVGDPCGRGSVSELVPWTNRPAAPPCGHAWDSSPPLFCDLQRGPDAGRCTACRDGYVPADDATDLGRDWAVLDFHENCYGAYGVYDCTEPPCDCPHPCYEGTFCSYDGRGCEDCREKDVMQPSDCDSLDGYSEEGVKACKEVCRTYTTDKICGRNLPCRAAEDGTRFFCDFQFGPDAGGYCVACGAVNPARTTDDSPSFNDLGMRDHEVNCRGGYDCPEPCGEDNFCSFEEMGCLRCEEWVKHPSECSNYGFSKAAVAACKESCRRRCSLDTDCWSSIFDGYEYHCNEGVCEEHRFSLPFDLHQGTGECGSGFNDCIGYAYETHYACFQACSEKWGTTLYATDWNKEDGECCCQDSCDFWSRECETVLETAVVPGKTVPEHACRGTCTSDADCHPLIDYGYHHFCNEGVCDSHSFSCIKNDDCRNDEFCDTSTRNGKCEECPTYCGINPLDEASLENCAIACNFCSDRLPCPFPSGSWYCDYRQGEYGSCRECSSDDDEQKEKCFFSGLPLRAAQKCATTCKSTLASSSCKFCGEGISGSSLRSASEDEPVCDFCPDGLKRSHWDRTIPFIGSTATCYKMNQFFSSYQISKSDQNCELAQTFNYICGCEGPGYTGANSDAKKKALVWVPRSAAVTSFLGSSAIIVDILRDRTKRKKIHGQLMVTMSAFDLMGSASYSLTSLPIPEEYYIHGSSGSRATCRAQGFLIQMGTVAAFVNVSLALYYYYIIKLGWTESRIKKVRHWLFLCPIAVGLAFAFAGLRFYEMLFLWCNNGAPWWPEIPVILAIFLATCTMASVCWDVYKTEQRTRRYAGGGARDSMSSAVFWQSIWYLCSFYVTWLPYLALQYLWSYGSGYSSYGFVIFAGTFVPLQGFWNSVVYFRKRAKKKVAAIFSTISISVSEAFASRFEAKTPTTATTAAESGAVVPETSRNVNDAVELGQVNAGKGGNKAVTTVGSERFYTAVSSAVSEEFVSCFEANTPTTATAAAEPGTVIPEPARNDNDAEELGQVNRGEGDNKAAAANVEDGPNDLAALATTSSLPDTGPQHVGNPE